MWWQMWEPRQEFALLMTLLLHCRIVIRILEPKIIVVIIHFALRNHYRHVYRPFDTNGGIKAEHCFQVGVRIFLYKLHVQVLYVISRFLLF